MIAAVGLGAILFAAGGTDIPGIGGQKWLRRFLLSFIWGVLCLLAKIIWWKCLIIWLGYTVVFHFGYGEKYPWWAKFLVGCSYSLPLLVYGLSPWLLICPVTFIILFVMSNLKATAKYFPWKICEGAIGFTLACGVCFKF